MSDLDIRMEEGSDCCQRRADSLDGLELVIKIGFEMKLHPSPVRIALMAASKRPSPSMMLSKLGMSPNSISAIAA